MSEPRATRIVVPEHAGVAADLWMGGAHSAAGELLLPHHLAGAWVVDCAGDMPAHYRPAAAWWTVRVFQDYEELPPAWPALADLARSIGRCLGGETNGHAAEHPAEPPARLYVLCNQGMNRSGLVMGRVLRALGLTGDEALDLLRRHRPGAVNNLTFARLIREEL